MNLSDLNPLAAIGGKLIDRFLPDPAAAAAAKQELAQMQENGELARMANETKLVELTNANTDSARDMNAKVQESVQRLVAGQEHRLRAGRGYRVGHHLFGVVCIHQGRAGSQQRTCVHGAWLPHHHERHHPELPPWKLPRV